MSLFPTFALYLIPNEEYWRDTSFENPWCLDAGDEEELASMGIYNLSPVYFKVREKTYPVGECEPFVDKIKVSFVSSRAEINLFSPGFNTISSWKPALTFDQLRVLAKK